MFSCVSLTGTTHAVRITMHLHISLFFWLIFLSAGSPALLCISQACQTFVPSDTTTSTECVSGSFVNGI